MQRRHFLAGAASGLLLGQTAMAQSRLRAVRRDGSLVVQDGERPVLAYRHAPVSGPPGTGPLFTRSGYLHPLHAPCGAQVTDDFPADHLHQRGVFFAWTRTRMTLDGAELEPDFWNLGGGTGRVRSAGLEEEPAGGGRLRFRARHIWEARRGDEWVEALAETWEVTVHEPAFTDPQDPAAAYVIDLISRQSPRADLELPQYRYGGMAVRGARAWLGKNSAMRVVTSEGRGRADADHSPARWVDMSGPVDGREAGVALLEHPGNPRTPNPLRLHPDVPYYVFALPQRLPYTLAAGREHLFRYRVIAHNGLADAGAGQAWWRAYTG